MRPRLWLAVSLCCVALAAIACGEKPSPEPTNRNADVAEVPQDVYGRVQHLAKRVYRALDLNGYARIDLRLGVDGRPFVLEANPNPNIAYGEDFAESAEVSGLSYERLLERIIALGLRWEPARTG